MRCTIRIGLAADSLFSGITFMQNLNVMAFKADWKVATRLGGTAKHLAALMDRLTLHTLTHLLAICITSNNMDNMANTPNKKDLYQSVIDLALRRAVEEWITVVIVFPPPRHGYNQKTLTKAF